MLGLMLGDILKFYFACLQPCCPGNNDIELCKDDFYEGFTMHDAGMTFETYEELFTSSRNQTRDLFDDAGLDSYFDMKENSATNSPCYDEFAEEVYFYEFSLL